MGAETGIVTAGGEEVPVDLHPLLPKQPLRDGVSRGTVAIHQRVWFGEHSAEGLTELTGVIIEPAHRVVLLSNGDRTPESGAADRVPDRGRPGTLADPSTELAEVSTR